MVQHSKYNLVYTDKKKLAGRLSEFTTSAATCLCIACQFHGCKKLVRTHLVPDWDLVVEWLRAGEHCSKEEHQAQFYSFTGISPPVPPKPKVPKGASEGGAAVAARGRGCKRGGCS